MGKLILIRHASPEVDPRAPPVEWSLSKSGRSGAARLAEGLSDEGIRTIFTSEETKAIETGRIIGEHLGVETRTVPGLQEHDRTGVGFLDQIAFDLAIERLFSRPSEMVFGRESGDAAAARFLKAIHDLEIEDPSGSYGCVTHGTVMALAAARLSGKNGYPIWRQLGLPSTITLDLETRTIVRIENHY